MSERYVWASRAMTDSTRIKGFDSEMFEQDKETTLDAMRRHERGEPLSPDRYPKKIFADLRDEKRKRQPNLFMGHDFWIVSEACASVLREFDLGRTKLYPIELFQYDRVTPIEGTYFVLALGEQKTAYAGEHATRRNPSRSSVNPDRMPLGLEDDELAVYDNVFDGPDLWVDPSLINGLFLSQNLGLALKKAKLTRDWKPRKCRVINRSS